jgi:hypothetical protein
LREPYIESPNFQQGGRVEAAAVCTEGAGKFGIRVLALSALNRKAKSEIEIGHFKSGEGAVSTSKWS